MIAALAVLVAALGGVLAWVMRRLDAEEEDRCASAVRADEGIARLDAALEATAKAVTELRAGGQRWDGLWKSLAGSCDQLCTRVEAQTRMLRTHEAELTDLARSDKNFAGEIASSWANAKRIETEAMALRGQQVGLADALAVFDRCVTALEQRTVRSARKAARR